MPGVSRKTTCASGSVRMPRMRLRVVCGLGVTMATLAPTRAFRSVDLPTFGRPTMAAYPARWAILGGCPSSHGGCGERSGGCERRARSSLLRRAFRHASSVVAALAALAPRLVRLAHHDYPDRLLAMRGTLGLARKVLGRLAPYGGLFAAAVAQVLAIGFLELAKPWPLKVIVDNVLGGRPLAWPWVSGLGARGLLAAACGALVGVYALLGALGVSSNYATISVGQRMVNDFRSELYAHLQRLSLAFHSRRQVGDLLYRLTADTFAIQTLTMNGFFPIISSLVMLVGMLRLDWVLTLIALGIVPVLFLSIVGMSRRMNALASDSRVKESALWAVAQ